MSSSALMEFSYMLLPAKNPDGSTSTKEPISCYRHKDMLLQIDFIEQLERNWAGITWIKHSPFSAAT
jgi:hypothetical protein